MRRDPARRAQEAAVVVALVFGWFILVSLFAVALGYPVGGAYSNAALIVLVLGEAAFASLAILYLRGRGYPVRELLPRPSLYGTLLGVAICLVFWLTWPLLASVLPLERLAALPVLRLAEQTRPWLPVVIAVACLNALYEEVFLLGYLARAFEAAGPAFAVGLAVLVRILYHAYQGPLAAVSSLLFGVLVTVFYWRTRLLWPAVVSHAVSDIAALT